ncbi:MAG TPA: 16S rRNA (cytidine(1402)-2'-O)-methyltransferase [Candidatus Kapabacteria bacterium]|nr:16S rRNA (cytidine(1402)-2'-O)-methyltransferase [Candidatus Kapabacteria bacterium]
MSEEIENSKKSHGKLYIVSTPIGNKDDFTVRAMNSLKRCDFVICEETKIGARTLKQINLSKELIPLNEHNEEESTNEIIDRIKNGEKACLISDDGTPLIADPGNYFIKKCIANDIDIEVVPGVTSIITALVRSGLATHEFVFAGFLNRKTEEKFQEVKELAREKRTVVLLETPYRLVATLEVLSKIMPDRKAYIGMNLTYAYETHHYGTFEELYNKFADKELKAEFVICFEGSIFNKNRNYEEGSDSKREHSFERRDFDRKPREEGGFNRERRPSYGNDRRRDFDRKPREESGYSEREHSFERRDFDRKPREDGGFNRERRPSYGNDRRRDDRRRNDGNRNDRSGRGFDRNNRSNDFSKSKKSYSDNRKFDKPKSFNFTDGDFEQSGTYSNDWKKPFDSKRRDNKFGDRKERGGFGKRDDKSFGKDKKFKSNSKFAASKFKKRNDGKSGGRSRDRF